MAQNDAAWGPAAFELFSQAVMYISVSFCQMIKAWTPAFLGIQGKLRIMCFAPEICAWLLNLVGLFLPTSSLFVLIRYLLLL